MAHERDKRICRRFKSLHRVSPAIHLCSSCILTRKPYDTRLSIDVSMGFVFSDLRNEDNPGVRAAEFETILMCFYVFQALTMAISLRTGEEKKFRYCGKIVCRGPSSTSESDRTVLLSGRTTAVVKRLIVSPKIKLCRIKIASSVVSDMLLLNEAN